MKKNLRTKIAACLVAATTAVSASAPAFAANVDSLYEKYFTDSNAIDIVYNGEVLTYTDVQPQLINDRTMIPFRTVLEGMGATVNYDEATRMVTAVRGGTTIMFSLDGNVIDIDKNGEKSQITMDVPLAVVNDRTLVPIRFMSNALGMNVGWESDLKTVVILDSEAYVNELTALENLGKLMQLENKMPAVQNGAFSIALDFALSNAGETMAFDVALDTNYDVTCVDGVIGGKAAINLDIDGLNDMIKQMSEEGVELKNIENATIDVVADEGVVYFKTDIVEKLAAAYPSAKQLQSIAAFADKDTWFKWDMAKTFNDLAATDPSIQPMADLINGGITGLNNMKGEDAFKMVASRQGDVTLSDVIAIDAVMDAYKFMDKYITITVGENGDYTMNIDINKDMLKEVMASMGADVNDESMIKALDSITFSMKGNSSQKDGKMASSVDYVIGIDLAEEGTALKFNIKMTAEASGDMNATTEAAKVPAAAIDVMDIIEAL